MVAQNYIKREYILNKKQKELYEAMSLTVWGNITYADQMAFWIISWIEYFNPNAPKSNKGLLRTTKIILQTASDLFFTKIQVSNLTIEPMRTKNNNA